jgi:hypothetical protein
MSHPAPVYLPSSRDQAIFQNDRESQVFGIKYDLSFMLSESASAEDVSLVLPSSANPVKPHTLHSNSWDDQMSLSYLSGDNNLSSPDELGLGVPIESRGFQIPVESWGYQQPFWSNESYSLVCGRPYPGFERSSTDTRSKQPPSESALPGPSHHYSDKSLYSPILGTEMSLDTGSESVDSSQLSLSSQPPIYLGTAPFFGAENVPESSQDNLEYLQSPTKAFPRVPTQGTTIPIRSVRKELLKLKIELLEDLEMYESDSVALASESLLNDLFNPAVARLNLPTSRMLNHSSRLLDMIQALHKVPERLNVTAITSPTRSQSCGLKDSPLLFQDCSDSSSEQCATTISSHPSDRERTVESSPYQAMIPRNPHSDITVWLSILEAHCYLMRIYHAVFIRLYQLFLIIPPMDAAMYLLLPKLHLGQFHMDENLAIQTQILVDLSSSMMGQIDEVLGLSSNDHQTQREREVHLPGLVGDRNWSTTLRDIVLAQEQDPGEMSLGDVMKCLLQLAQEHAFV